MNGIVLLFLSGSLSCDDTRGCCPAVDHFRRPIIPRLSSGELVRRHRASEHLESNDDTRTADV